MRILFTICGRAGSKGFKNKNIQKMNGIPLVYYTLAVIRGYMDKHSTDDVCIALNTDSIELQKQVCRQKLVKDVVIVKRRESLAGDLVSKVDVIKDTFCELGGARKFDAVVDLDITSPLRRVRDIENAINEFSANENYDLVFSVVNSRRSPYFNMVEKGLDGYYKMVCRTEFTTRQQTPKCYEMNASIYVYRPSFLEREIKGTILDSDCGICIMEDYLVLDIDSESDFAKMEFLHTHYIEIDEELRNIYEVAKKAELENKEL